MNNIRNITTHLTRLLIARFARYSNRLIQSLAKLKRIKKLLHNSYSRKLFFILLVAFFFVVKEASLADESKYHEFIKRVSEEITKLKETYTQLKEFSIDKHADIENLKIDYCYHTHKSEHTGGWTSGVPNPDPDGIWFYIDLHDKDSTAQIHTQPITGASLQIGNKSICFLILEGEATRSVSGEISSILERNGAKSVH